MQRDDGWWVAKNIVSCESCESCENVLMFCAFKIIVP